jgi:hypothetical protein
LFLARWGLRRNAIQWRFTTYAVLSVLVKMPWKQFPRLTSFLILSRTSINLLLTHSRYHGLGVHNSGSWTQQNSSRQESLYRWLLHSITIYRFWPFPKIVFAIIRLDYIKSRYIYSLLLEDIINLVASRFDYIMVL